MGEYKGLAVPAKRDSFNTSSKTKKLELDTVNHALLKSFFPILSKTSAFIKFKLPCTILCLDFGDPLCTPKDYTIVAF